MKIPRIDLTPLPLAGVREDWIDWINTPQTAEEERAVLRAFFAFSFAASRLRG